MTITGLHFHGHLVIYQNNRHPLFVSLKTTIPLCPSYYTTALCLLHYPIGYISRDEITKLTTVLLFTVTQLPVVQVIHYVIYYIIIHYVMYYIIIHYVMYYIIL